MNIIRICPDENGGHPCIQSWDSAFPPDGYAVWPEELDTKEFYAHNGFVTLNIENEERIIEQDYFVGENEETKYITEPIPTVKSYEPNIEAWEIWNASQPEPKEPEPTPQEDTEAMLIDHEYRLTLLELGV